MRTITYLATVFRDSYAAIMDPDKNPLRVLPPAQRVQTMVYLSVMWTTIFCAAFGSWYWYGELIVGHVLVVLGIALTTITFSRAARQVTVPVVVKSYQPDRVVSNTPRGHPPQGKT